MLEELHVRDLALIEEAWLELGPGLNVLSGETGAGKTVLVEALQLLLGERADSTMVRSGAPEALVEGRFLSGTRERTARRRVSAEGRSRCYLDEGMATVGELGSVLGPLVDLHGQHDHQALLRPAAHGGYLVRFAGEATIAAREAYAAAYVNASALREELQTLTEALSDREDRRGFLAFQVEEIDQVAPTPQEDARLEATLPRLRHGERLTEAASQAFQALRADEAACDGVGIALDVLRGAEGIDAELDEIARQLDAALTQLDDVALGLRRYGEAVDHDPAALNDAEARLAALADLKRKYGPTLEDVLAARDEAVRQLEALDGGEERLAAVRAALEEGEGRLSGAAKTLTALLREAAVPFQERLAGAAADLAMGATRFEVQLQDLPSESWTESGPTRIEFLFSSSAGDAPRPLAKIASGGEVSRVMLALKSVLGEADETAVLVFDEIDAGIGGQTAVAVGARLAELAGTHQVLVVTHLAQVAAFADRHLVVTKDEQGERSVTKVCVVEGEARVHELARMLSGSDSETGLAHARELLEAAEVRA